jgi:pseudouridine synthase
MEEKMRIQKYLSQNWVCSRRKAEEYIKAWQVKVNSKIAKIWQSIISWVDNIELLDKAIAEQKSFVYYKINKPRWVITTCAEYWDENIIDIIDIRTRVFPVWRLDKESTGLILLTNDGRLTNYLIHPKYEHEKEYVVETFWPISDSELDKISRPMYMLWSETKEAVVKRMSSWMFSIILTEWKNRQIRRLVENVWNKVKKLKRIRIENIKLWNLDYWEYKELSKKEKDVLFDKIWLKK